MDRLSLFLTPFVAFGLFTACSDAGFKGKKPVNSKQEIEETEEVADLDRDKPNLFDRNQQELREFRRDPRRYSYRYGSEASYYLDFQEQEDCPECRRRTSSYMR